MDSIRWSDRDPLDLLNIVTDTPWHIVEKGGNKNKKFRNAKLDTIGLLLPRDQFLFH